MYILRTIFNADKTRTAPMIITIIKKMNLETKTKHEPRHKSIRSRLD